MTAILIVNIKLINFFNKTLTYSSYFIFIKIGITFLEWFNLQNKLFIKIKIKIDVYKITNKFLLPLLFHI